MRTGDPFRVYVASPLGYTLPSRIFYNRTLLPTLRGNGLEVVDPWAVDSVDSVDHVDADALAVGRRVERMLRSADVVFAILDGADLDGGTAVEIGFAAGLGLPVVGWRSDLRSVGERQLCLSVPVEHIIGLNGGSLHADLGTAIDALVSLRRSR